MPFSGDAPRSPRRYTAPRSAQRERASAPPPGSEQWQEPWVQLRYVSYHPAIYPNMLGAVSPAAQAGDLVQVYTKQGTLFGHGFYNPKARVPLRILHHGSTPFTEDDLDQRLHTAIQLRSEDLNLPAQTEAWRVIHSDGDALSGLIVDRYQDVLSIEVTNLACWQRLPRWIPLLHAALGTRHQRIQVPETIGQMEGIPSTSDELVHAPCPDLVRFTENGVRYAANFATGHKTGFFCDQRDNRRQLAAWAKGRMLDLCCYTGGFALSAKKAGCEDVTAVDLDEKAIEQAKQNANFNQTRVNWVHADAFSWLRQMIQNQQTWDTVVLDPPKLIHNRDQQEEGIFKYRDLNALALRVLSPGGLFVTCSCSGHLSTEAFEELVIGTAHRHDYRLQILQRSGAGADHPVYSNCPESRYLKVLWCRVWKV